jgi:hypothetical protein
MKTIITFLLMIAAIGVNAQTKIRSNEGDTVLVPKGAYVIDKMVATSLTDTARSVTYSITQMQRDTTVGFFIRVVFYNKQGAEISNAGYLQLLQPLPGTAAYMEFLDSRISIFNPRIHKQ